MSTNSVSAVRSGIVGQVKRILRQEADRKARKAKKEKSRKGRLPKAARADRDPVIMVANKVVVIKYHDGHEEYRNPLWGKREWSYDHTHLQPGERAGWYSAAVRESNRTDSYLCVKTN